MTHSNLRPPVLPPDSHFPTPRPFAWAAMAGCAFFIFCVVFLTLTQADYDSRTQLMSELALGRGGLLMLFAFLALALATGMLALALRYAGTKAGTVPVLFLAATAFAAAGIFPLGSATTPHIVSIGTAFIASGLAMYLLPGSLILFSGRRWRLLSWGCAATMALAVALGLSLLPAGLAQRLAALALLIWIVGSGWRLSRD